MDEHLVSLLAKTHSIAHLERSQAEQALLQLYQQQEFPLSLISLASRSDNLPIDIRQSALLVLKQYVLATWSSQYEEFQGHVFLDDSQKSHVRQSLLQLAISDSPERKIQNAACYVVSKIASADFPDPWQDLLPTIMATIQQASDDSVHGALKVLSELVDDGFDEAQFFQIAPDLVSVVFAVASNDGRSPFLRALAVSVFRDCFDTLEVVLEDHKTEVKAFAEQSLKSWTPLFLAIVKTELHPPAPDKQDLDHVQSYRGWIALKVQVAKTLIRIRNLFAALLTSHSVELFFAMWERLSALQSIYRDGYILHDSEGRMEDTDGLAYTLDFLILEELDFMQACLRAPPVRKELEARLKNHDNANGNNWITELIKLATSYAQIPSEEEGMWEIDVNVYLAEETSVTTNYTPRMACGDLVVKLGEWLKGTAAEGILTFIRSELSTTEDWKMNESALFILNGLLADWQDVNLQLEPRLAQEFLEIAIHAQKHQQAFLRARGFIVAANLMKTSGDALHSSINTVVKACLHAIHSDTSEIVQVSCIRALQIHVQALPRAITQPMQSTVISALQQWINSRDMGGLGDSDDLLITLVECLRDFILLDTRVCLTGEGINLLFNLSSHVAENFQMAKLVSETFEEICSTINPLGADAYVQLCQRVLPSLTGAFDVGDLTAESALTSLAADLLAELTKYAPEPLPPGFVSAVMPKLHRLLLGSNDDELLKACTSSVKHILIHDTKQLFEWHDESSKSGLEVVLIIIDRLLNPTTSDNAAAEVGGLAAEVVQRATAEQLGPYLLELLRAVAVRVASAEQAHLIQSLVTVFARLSLTNPTDVLDFLSQVQIGPDSGLQLVLNKWLDNAGSFAGYDDIRQTLIGLSRLWALHDDRLTQTLVRGDLIVQQSDRILTRSKARQNPDTYTVIPAPLKIIKVLLDELVIGDGANVANAAAAALDDDDSDDDADDWEDEPDVLGGLGIGRDELLAFAAEKPGAGRGFDGETQTFLESFFRDAAREPTFRETFDALTPLEQEKLRALG